MRELRLQENLGANLPITTDDEWKAQPFHHLAKRREDLELPRDREPRTPVVRDQSNTSQDVNVGSSAPPLECVLETLWDRQSDRPQALLGDDRRPPPKASVFEVRVREDPIPPQTGHIAGRPIANIPTAQVLLDSHVVRLWDNMAVLELFVQGGEGINIGSGDHHVPGHLPPRAAESAFLHGASPTAYASCIGLNQPLLPQDQTPPCPRLRWGERVHGRERELK